MKTINVGRRGISFFFQGPQADQLARPGCLGRVPGCQPAIDLDRLRRVARPLLARPAVIIVHVNDRCRCVTGSWYGRARSFRYFNHAYRDFDGDVITLVVNRRWFRRRQVVHGPYYLAAAKRFGRYPRQTPMDALVYVLAHELAHHYLYWRRHPMRFSERATDLFALQHLHQVEPNHPITRGVPLTDRESGLLLAMLRRMTPPAAAPGLGRRRVACKRRAATIASGPGRRR